MEEKVFAHLGTYLDIYGFVAERSRDIDEIRTFLTEKNIPSSTVQSRIDAIKGKNPGLFKVNGNLVSINDVEARKVVAEINEAFEPVTRFNAGDLSEMRELEAENEKLKGQVESLKQSKATEKKRKRVRKQTAEKLIPKVLILDSVRVGPIEDVRDGMFLSPDTKSISVDEMVGHAALLKDAFYRDLGKEHEMTEANYRRKTFLDLFTENRFIKRLRESKFLQKLMPGKKLSMKDAICKRLHISKAEANGQVDYLKGRAISVQELLEDNKLTNQEKLALYAFNSPYRNTDMERLLNLAGDECVNANWLISMLETPDIGRNYENLRDMIRQCSKASEWSMKKQLAEELIQGQWYITANYEGVETRFQLVPVNELAEIREILDLEDKDFEYSLSLEEPAVKDAGETSSKAKAEASKQTSQKEAAPPKKGKFVKSFGYKENEPDEADPSVYSYGEKPKEGK